MSATTEAGVVPSVTRNVPDTTDACAVGVRVVVPPLVIVGFPNAAANGLASDNVGLSGSVATKLIAVDETETLLTTGGSLTAVMLIVAVSNEDRSPPVPVLPLSCTVIVSVALALGVSVLSL